MSARDHVKPAEYWPELLEAQAGFIRDTDRTCRTTDDPRHRQATCARVWLLRLEHVIAHYSAGSSTDEISRHFSLLVDEFVRHAEMPEYLGSDLRQIDYYVKLLWIVSLGYLLGDHDGVAKVVGAARHDGKDGVLDRTIALSVPAWKVRNELVHPKLTAPLLAAFTERKREQASAHVEDYLRGYYKGLKSTWFWGRHLKDDVLYFGYWSFEAAAAVRARKLDDSAFRDSKYYPAELG